MAGFCDALIHVQRSPSAPPVKIDLSDTTTASFQNPEADIDGPKRICYQSHCQTMSNDRHISHDGQPDHTEMQNPNWQVAYLRFCQLL